jgi:hypothetical protein
VQRKFSYCQNHDRHCDFQDWPLSLEGPSILGASKPPHWRLSPKT